MNGFDAEHFATLLLSDALLYDQEYGVLGIVSLIDATEDVERYAGSFDPDTGTFAIEKATAWAPSHNGEDIGFTIATDLEEYERYETPEETAAALLDLARDEDLLPSLSLFFESDEME